MISTKQVNMINYIVVCINEFAYRFGPVANDDLALLFRTFTNGLIDLYALVNGLEYKKLTDQYSFHTDKALQYLKLLGGI